MTPNTERLSYEQIKRAVGASDEYWATSKMFIIGIARAIEDALAASPAPLREADEGSAGVKLEAPQNCRYPRCSCTPNLHTWAGCQAYRGGIEADGDGGKAREDLVIAYGRACIDWAQADPDNVQQKHDAMKAARAALLSPTSPPNGKTADEAPRCRCDRCGRKSWDDAERGRFCNMPQPGNRVCSGIMHPAAGDASRGGEHG